MALGRLTPVREESAMSHADDDAGADNTLGDATADLGCLLANFGRTEVRWRFRDPHSPRLEVNAALQEQLRDFLQQHADRATDKKHVLDLQQLPALSSRQLGTMLTLSKALDDWGGLHLAHVSEAVRHLLTLTRMERFYKFLDE
jgi:anti-anti-sigma factor